MRSTLWSETRPEQSAASEFNLQLPFLRSKARCRRQARLRLRPGCATWVLLPWPYCTGSHLRMFPTNSQCSDSSVRSGGHNTRVDGLRGDAGRCTTRQKQTWQGVDAASPCARKIRPKRLHSQIGELMPPRWPVHRVVGDHDAAAAPKSAAAAAAAVDDGSGGGGGGGSGGAGRHNSLSHLPTLHCYVCENREKLQYRVRKDRLVFDSKFIRSEKSICKHLFWNALQRCRISESIIAVRLSIAKVNQNTVRRNDYFKGIWILHFLNLEWNSERISSF